MDVNGLSVAEWEVRGQDRRRDEHLETEKRGHGKREASGRSACCLGRHTRRTSQSWPMIPKPSGLGAHHPADPHRPPEASLRFVKSETRCRVHREGSQGVGVQRRVHRHYTRQKPHRRTARRHRKPCDSRRRKRTSGTSPHRVQVTARRPRKSEAGTSLPSCRPAPPRASAWPLYVVCHPGAYALEIGPRAEATAHLFSLSIGCKRCRRSGFHWDPWSYFRFTTSEH